MEIQKIDLEALFFKIYFKSLILQRPVFKFGHVTTFFGYAVQSTVNGPSLRNHKTEGGKSMHFLKDLQNKLGN